MEKQPFNWKQVNWKRVAGRTGTGVYAFLALWGAFMLYILAYITYIGCFIKCSPSNYEQNMVEAIPYLIGAAIMTTTAAPAAQFTFTGKMKNWQKVAGITFGVAFILLSVSLPFA